MNKGGYWIEYISTKVTYLSHWCLMAMIKYSFNLLAIDTISSYNIYIECIYTLLLICVIYYSRKKKMWGRRIKKVLLLHTDEKLHLRVINQFFFSFICICRTTGFTLLHIAETFSYIYIYFSLTEKLAIL